MDVKQILSRPPTWSKISGTLFETAFTAVTFASLRAAAGPMDSSQPSWLVNAGADGSTLTLMPPATSPEDMLQGLPRVTQRSTRFDFATAPFLLTVELVEQGGGRPWEVVTWRGGASQMVERSSAGVTAFGDHDACHVVRDLQPSAELHLLRFTDPVEAHASGRHLLTATGTWASGAAAETSPFSTSPGGDEFLVTVDVDWGVVVRVEKRFKGEVAAVHELRNVTVG